MTTGTPSDPLAPFRLDDRLIVVTGASEGIGRAFAECFARAGAYVVLSSRRKDVLETVRQGIVASGGRAEVVAADVCKLGDIRNLADAVGRLAEQNDRRLVLVNNAGFGFTKATLETTERSASTDVGKSAYCAAKAAVSHLTAALSTEWAQRGVRVNALAPTATLTDFTARVMASNPERAQGLLGRIKLGRFAQPSDLLGAAVFLASGASDFVTGQTLFVDGGFTT